ncbi:MAG: hypothetical protein WDM77_00105 [Steroidobacteraceae bacterium]
MPIPNIAHGLQAQEILLAIAIPPKTITKMTAMGVIHARMLVCREVAPVMNGDSCAQLSVGTASSAAKGQRAGARIDRDCAVDFMISALRDKVWMPCHQRRVARTSGS